MLMMNNSKTNDTYVVSAQTGDSSPITFFVVAAGICLLVLIGLIGFNRKEKNDKNEEAHDK